ncbi:uncharacterized protein LOC144557316 [Carex rostrata]
MTSACLAMLAPPLFPSTAAEQFQLQCPALSSPPNPKLQGLLPFHFQSQPKKPNLRGANHSLSLNPNPNPNLIDVQDSKEEDSALFGFSSYQGIQPCAQHKLLLSPSPDNIITQMLLQMPAEQAEMLAQFLTSSTMSSPSSLLTVDPSGRILFTGCPTKMRDLLSIIAEFNTFPTHTSSSKPSLLVPYFDRARCRARADTKGSLLNFPTETVTPLKSKEINKTKSPPKKKQKKNTSYNRDIFQKNYFHVCESLLSLLLDKNITSTGRGTSLKKLGPEISHILTSFSVGIAGTGLAVLLSVACKMTGPGMRVPLSTTRVFNTGFGLGLFWLSWAVNGLRDAIVQGFRGSNKLKIKDEEMALKVERSMRDVLVRAGTLVALAALRFA